MVTLVRGQAVTSRLPTLDIDAGLAPGAHRFQLEVVDTAGNRSRADVATVTVQRRIVVDPVRPPIVVEPVRPPVVDPVRPVVQPVVRPSPAPPSVGEGAPRPPTRFPPRRP